MKLTEVIRQGKFCGLETIGECIMNFQLHMIQMFPHSQVRAELDELNKDIDAWEHGELDLDMEEIDRLVAQDMLEYDEWCRTHYQEEPYDYLQELEFLHENH